MLSRSFSRPSVPSVMPRPSGFLGKNTRTGLFCSACLSKVSKWTSDSITCPSGLRHVDGMSPLLTLTSWIDQYGFFRKRSSVCKNPTCVKREKKRSPRTLYFCLDGPGRSRRKGCCSLGRLSSHRKILSSCLRTRVASLHGFACVPTRNTCCVNVITSFQACYSRVHKRSLAI